MNIESTYFTPSVEFDSENKILRIVGRVLETKGDTMDNIFTRICDWLDKYFKTQKGTIVIKFRLSYYNTTSTKNMVRFLHHVETLYQKGNNVSLVWEYEDGDEDGLADGEAFKKLCNIPFTINKV